MQRYSVLGLAALLLAFGASNSALAMRFKVDAPNNTNDAALFQINPSQLGTTFSVTPTPCADFGGLPLDLDGYVSCFGFNNATRTPIDRVAFSFTVPTGSALIGQTLTCETGTYLSNWSCPSGTLAADTPYTMVFFGGSPILGNNDFYFGSDVDLTGVPFTFSPNPVPEPAGLGVFGLGLLGIGLALGWRRRERKRHSAAAEVA